MDTENSGRTGEQIRRIRLGDCFPGRETLISDDSREEGRDPMVREALPSH